MRGEKGFVLLFHFARNTGPLSAVGSPEDGSGDPIDAEELGYQNIRPLGACVAFSVTSSVCGNFRSSDTVNHSA